MLLDELTAICYPFTSDRARLAWTTFIEHSKLFQVLQFKLGATDDVYRTVEANNTPAGRAEGGTYTGTLNTPNAQIASSLLFMGYKIFVDESRRKDAELGLRDFEQWLTDQISENSYAFAMKMEEYYFKGPGTGNVMKGLSLILNGTDDIPGFTGQTGVINAADALSGSNVSFDLENEDNWAPFVRFCRRIKPEVRGATHWECNSDLAGIISAIADNKRVLGNTETTYGYDVETFLGLPIIDVSSTAIGNDEEDDTSGTALENTTSLYLAANVQGRNHIRSNSGFYVKNIDEMEAGEKMEFLNEIRGEIEIRDHRSIRRIRNFKINGL